MIITGVSHNPDTIDINPCAQIVRHAAYQPDRIALIYEGEEITYAELQDIVKSWAAHLDEAGVRQGDRVAYLGMNSRSFIYTMLAAWWLGATFMPFNFRLSESEVSQLLMQGTPHTVVVEGTHLPMAKHIYGIERHHVIIVDDDAHAPVEGRVPLYWHTSTKAAATDCRDSGKPRPMTMNDLALLLFTSGTTGLPKGAQLTFGNLWWNSINVDTMVDSRPGDVTLASAPLFHVGALNSFAIRALVRGNTVLIHRHFDPGVVMRDIAHYQVGSAFLVPAQLEAMYAHPDFAEAKLDSMRATICAGSPVPPVLIRRYLEKGVNVQQAWGLTETAPFATYLPPTMTEAKVGSCGIPMPYTQIRLVDPDSGEEVRDAGITGELWVRGPNVATGYWNNPEITQKSYTAGWFHSGDLGHRDEEGFYYIVDRLKDMIITGGENVYPAEVERVVAEMDGVRGNAVIGLPDEKWGESVVSVVQLDPGAEINLEQLREHCERHLARYKLPKRLVIVDEIARNSAGKIDKLAIRRHVYDLLEDEQ
ncbi:long-chain fatty acid--CoA ligase [Corynebacterium canis]|uniref:Long-chain fatty acid--CoA ligase n=1 Tax=Corynebacterium canis TaxID=679663 RepID=A0A5C5UIH8_9CORY|nr:long-chain fatty acid--CoA ligase [Corynebacterium canis]TWT25493.1 long-chain fatty acid--CoA ligase [Corynebacterium canis]WJY76181.1 Long-chain-fatty-acid--CoA ligase [Corynebacterium canis]